MCVLCVYYIMYIGVAPTKATAEGESVRMKMKKKRAHGEGKTPAARVLKSLKRVQRQELLLRARIYLFVYYYYCGRGGEKRTE